MIPASNQKLLVAAAALHVLGPEHTFTTEVRAGGVSGGVVAGDLYLVGGGDPLLTTSDYPAETINGYPVLNATSLDALADSVVAAGITQIEGNIVGDGSRYDDEWFDPSWPEEIRVTEAGPVDALMVNDVRFLTDEWQPANDPNAGAAEELGRLLEERGVTIGGQGESGTAPADAAAIASIESAPLPTVIAEMQATSDNNTAEMLLKELGVAAGPAGRGSPAPPPRWRRSPNWGSIPPASSSTTASGPEHGEPGDVPAAGRHPLAARAGRRVRGRAAPRRRPEHHTAGQLRRHRRSRAGCTARRGRCTTSRTTPTRRR